MVVIVCRHVDPLVVEVCRRLGPNAGGTAARLSSPQSAQRMTEKIAALDAGADTVIQPVEPAGVERWVYANRGRARRQFSGQGPFDRGGWRDRLCPRPTCRRHAM